MTRRVTQPRITILALCIQGGHAGFCPKINLARVCALKATSGPSVLFTAGSSATQLRRWQRRSRILFNLSTCHWVVLVILSLVCQIKWYIDDFTRAFSQISSFFSYCRTITAEFGSFVRIDFRDMFRIEPANNEGSCEYDYLEIRDGDQGYAPLIGK